MHRNLDSGSITIANDTVQKENAHKKRGETEQKEEEMEQLDSGDVTIAGDDVQEKEANKKRGKTVQKEIIPPMKTSNEI